MEKAGAALPGLGKKMDGPCPLPRAFGEAEADKPAAK